MTDFLFQAIVQGLVIAAVWVLVDRDAGRLREQHGSTPADISPFAWGALSGLTWVALIPYLVLRRCPATVTAPARERNLLVWWVVLAGASAVWASSDATRDDANNAAQHALLAVAFTVCGLVAWSRDRELGRRHPDPGRIS